MIQRSFLSMILFGLLGLSMTGCGGGGSPAIPQTVVPLSTTCSDTEFVPNDIELKFTTHLYRLTKLPPIVYFYHDANYTQQRHDIAIAGFSQWVQATNGKIYFVETNNPSLANVTVDFTTQLPKGIWGVTDLNFDIYDQVLNGGAINITVGTEETQPRLQDTAAHEFGHVIGMNVHTTNCQDIMAGNFYCGFPTATVPLSQNDINTLKTAYCWLFQNPQSP